MSMEALVQLKTADGFMSLANLQAPKLRRIVQVTNARAAEAEGVLRYLRDNGNHNPEGQFASGKGFGRLPDLSEAPGPKCCKCASGTTVWSASGKCKPCDGQVELQVPAPQGCDPKDKEGFRGKKECVVGCKGPLALAEFAKKAAGGGIRGLINPLEEPDTSEDWKQVYDLDARDILEGVDNVMRASRRAVVNSTELANSVQRGAVAANSALRIAADELNYPGLPAETLPAPAPRRPRAPRPHDLAPSGLDFLFSSSNGSDPYRLPTEGTYRRTAGDILLGREVHNPFGTPPMPKPQVYGASAPGGAAAPGKPDAAAAMAGATALKGML